MHDTQSAVKVMVMWSKVKVQCDTTCAKICKIINNSAGDCSILLKFRTDFDHDTWYTTNF